MPFPVQSLLNQPTSSARDRPADRQKNRIRARCRIIIVKPFCQGERHPSMPDTAAVIETDIGASDGPEGPPTGGQPRTRRALLPTTRTRCAPPPISNPPSSGRSRDLPREIRRLVQPVPRAGEQAKNSLFRRLVTRQQAVAVEVYITAKQHALWLRKLSRCCQRIESPADLLEFVPSSR